MSGWCLCLSHILCIIAATMCGGSEQPGWSAIVNLVAHGRIICCGLKKDSAFIIYPKRRLFRLMFRTRRKSSPTVFAKTNCENCKCNAYTPKLRALIQRKRCEHTLPEFRLIYTIFICDMTREHELISSRHAAKF